MNSILCTLMLFSSSSALKISTKSYQPELVQLLANPGQGSTALSQLLMSSENVATLCKGETWQCEPCNFMEEGLCTSTHSDVNALRHATDTWAQYWDLSRPLLMKKSMTDVISHTVVEAHRVYLQLVHDGLPDRMKGAFIDGLRFAYIVLWRPLCLFTKTSKTFPGEKETVEQIEYLSNLVAAFPREIGARVLVINYGSLVWDMEKTKKRVEEFLPEAGALDTSFQPRMNVDIFPGNNWKANESISQYAFTHQNDPNTHGYNVVQQTCESGELTEQFAYLRNRYETAVAHLRSMSM